MKTLLLVLVCLAGAAPAAAQDYNVVINAESPEGQLMQQIGQEGDAAKKIALMEQFAAQYPKHEGISWVFSQLIPAYAKVNQPAKSLDVGEKLLALHPDDARASLECLKAAEATRDPDLVLQWAIRASDISRKVAQTPKPAGEDAVEEWNRKVDFAKQLETYTEYSLSAMALQTADPAKKIGLVQALEQRNPQSQYLTQVSGQYFLALNQAGQADKAVAVAEKVLEKDPANEDMLLAAADYYMKKNNNPDKVLSYSAKLIEVMEAKPKPQGVSDEAWEKKKTVALGLAYWMTGVTYSGQNKYAPADEALRKALPLVSGNEQLKAETLFYLGLANYKMEKILDAIKFNEECSKIKGPLQARALQNLKAIRSKYRVVR